MLMLLTSGFSEGYIIEILTRRKSIGVHREIEVHLNDMHKL